MKNINQNEARFENKRPIIVFKGTVTSSEIANAIPKDFSGDIVINGGINDERYHTSTPINLNGGTLWITEKVFSVDSINVNGNVFCDNTILAWEHIKVNGTLYVRNNIQAPLIEVSEDLIVSDGTLFSERLFIGGEVEANRLRNNIFSSGEIHILGSVRIGKY